HRQRQRQDRQRPQQQQQPLLELESPDLALVHLGEELERREQHFFRPPPREQVDDHRNRRRGEAEQEQRIEEAHRGNSTYRPSESSQASRRGPGWIPHAAVRGGKPTTRGKSSASTSFINQPESRTRRGGRSQRVAPPM